MLPVLSLFLHLNDAALHKFHAHIALFLPPRNLMRWPYSASWYISLAFDKYSLASSVRLFVYSSLATIFSSIFSAMYYYQHPSGFKDHSYYLSRLYFHYSWAACSIFFISFHASGQRSGRQRLHRQALLRFPFFPLDVWTTPRNAYFLACVLYLRKKKRCVRPIK